MSTYKTVWMCTKCGVSCQTIKRGTGSSTVMTENGEIPLSIWLERIDHCPAGGDHDWFEIGEGTWSDD